MDYAENEHALTESQKSRMLRNACDMLKMADDIKARVMFKIIAEYPELKDYHGVQIEREDGKPIYAIAVKNKEEADKVIKKVKAKAELSLSSPLDDDIIHKILAGDEKLRAEVIEHITKCALEDEKRPKGITEENIEKYANMFIDECCKKQMKKMAKA